MSHPGGNPSPQIPPHQRWLLLLVSLVLLALLVVAAWLPPDPRGLGTHQGLGLPPCSFRQLTGLRCPSCGMTTAWSHLLRGQPVASARANVGGMLLGILVILLIPWGLSAAFRGRWLVRPPDERVAMVVVFGLLAITLVDWVVRLCLGSG